MTERLSQAREKVIRDWAANSDPGMCHSFASWLGFVRELLAEIDALKKINAEQAIIIHTHKWDELSAECAILWAEIYEQCRLNGMGSERKAKLMAQLAESKNELLLACRDLAAEEVAHRKVTDELGLKLSESRSECARYRAALEICQRELDRGNLEHCNRERALESILCNVKEALFSSSGNALKAVREAMAAMQNQATWLEPDESKIDRHFIDSLAALKKEFGE